MSDEMERRIADAERWGKVLTKLENIEAKLDLTNGRLNAHGDNIRSLEMSRSWALGAGTVFGAVAGWLSSHLGSKQ